MSDAQTCETFNSPQTLSRETAHDHTWVVFSTALSEGWLMLQCVDCGLHGVVEAPTAKEWKKAFHAPSRPYRWMNETRVTLKPEVPSTKRYVVRTDSGPKCECYTQRGVLEPRDYERFPNELTRPAVILTDADRQELAQLAEIATKGSLCSFFFEHFLICCENDTGHIPGNAVREVARRISAIDRKGLHCSGSVIARLLREIAGLPKTSEEGE